MLTMTVMQHERGAVGGFSKDVAEDKEDVLSCLRHLHRTLQECHWRVQSVDHALCAQGSRGLDGLQNQARNDYSFQYQAEKDYGLQNLSGDHNFMDDTGKDYSLQIEPGKDYHFHDEGEIIQNHENDFRKFSEQTNENYVQDNHEEDHAHQNENEKEFKSDSLSWKDHYHQKPAQEQHSLEDENLSLQDTGTTLFDLCCDFKENLPNQPTKDDDLQKAAIPDCAKLDYPGLDHSINNQTKEEESLLNITRSTCDLDCTNPLRERRVRWSIRQDAVDDDSAPANFLHPVSATVGLQHIFRDSSVSETSAVPYISNDDTQSKFLSPNLKCSAKATNEVSVENCNQSSEVRCRTGHKEGSLGSKGFDEGETDLLKNQNTRDASLEDQEDKTIRDEKTVGKVSLDTFPEVTQKIHVIWEALENLQSHFFALHSSIVSSSHCLNQKLNKSVDHFDIASVKIDKVAEPSYLPEEHHARCKDEADMLHHTTSEATQLSQSAYEEPPHKKTLLREPSGHICHPLSRDSTRSCTFHQQPACEASPSDSTAYRGTLRGWREGCLCTGMVLLLLLLLLFLASCLLLMLPVVSVSVRTAGGLPAF